MFLPLLLLIKQGRLRPSSSAPPPLPGAGSRAPAPPGLREPLPAPGTPRGARTAGAAAAPSPLHRPRLPHCLRSGPGTHHHPHPHHPEQRGGPAEPPPRPIPGAAPPSAAQPQRRWAPSRGGSHTDTAGAGAVPVPGQRDARASAAREEQPRPTRAQPAQDFTLKRDVMRPQPRRTGP